MIRNTVSCCKIPQNCCTFTQTKAWLSIARYLAQGIHFPVLRGEMLPLCYIDYLQLDLNVCCPAEIEGEVLIMTSMVSESALLAKGPIYCGKSTTEDISLRLLYSEARACRI